MGYSAEKKNTNSDPVTKKPLPEMVGVFLFRKKS
jgi:hypothetical protein